MDGASLVEPESGGARRSSFATAKPIRFYRMELGESSRTTSASTFQVCGFSPRASSVGACRGSRSRFSREGAGAGRTRCN
jgi:hypothetical protein